MNQIDTRTYDEYTMPENYISQYCLLQRASETRITCTSIFEIQYKGIIKYWFPCVKLLLKDIFRIYWALL